MTKNCFTCITSILLLLPVKKAAGRGRLPRRSLPCLFLVLDVDVLSVDHAFIFLLFLLRAAITSCARLRTTRTRSALGRLGGFIHGLRQFVRGLRKPFSRRVHDRRVGSFQRLLGIGQSRFHAALFVAGDLVTVLFQHLFDVVDHAVELVSRFVLSSAAWASASLAIRSTSSLLRPEDDVIVIFWSLPVARSLAVTFRMPLASMSKVTSICGTPRGAGGIPVRWNLPSVRFWPAIGRSPCSTWTSTEV